MQGDFSPDIKLLKDRVTNTWGARTGWTTIYQEAYDFAVPMRRPSGGLNGRPKGPDKLFDMTAPMSAMYFAGSLQRDLFPAGQPAFHLQAGPLTRLALKPADVEAFERELARTSALIHPFFLAGDWDTAIHEMCVDLAVGTGAILPVKGDRNNPVQFACIPFDELAIAVDGFGAVNLVDWQHEMQRDQIVDAWKDGRFEGDFKERAKTKPSDKFTVHQVWWRDADGRSWHFAAYIDGQNLLITHETYRTQPIAIARYYRVPGEAYGRGVVLTALPTIKTLNKAQEIALKSAAIGMLGIWGYRAGGTFNPNTARLAPGEFWGMQSTGGMLGPDVSRLDTPGNFNVAQVLIGNLKDDVKNAMFDERLPDYKGTPRSASEMAGRLQQRANIHIGAFGRLVREIMPTVVPRTAEILMEFGYLPYVTNIDDLMISVSVTSPMQAALNADRIAAIANYHDFVMAFAGQENAALYLDQDKVMTKIAEGLQIDKDLIPSSDEKENIKKEIAQAKQAQLVQLFAAEAAKQAPGMMRDAAMAEQGQRQAA